MKRIATIVILLGFISFSLIAQIGQLSSQDPPGIKWKKIDTPHFEIIFPLELTKEGQRVANTLEHIYKALSKTLQKEPKRITILLSNRSVISNGYVRLAPRMSEWFSVPSTAQVAGVIDWYNLLAIHEGRHIVQFEKLNQGFTKIAGILFGEYGRMVFSNLSTPPWFWEGDAVGMETALSYGGRGRQPSFDMDIRTILLSGIRYSYHKASLGSFKDWYPDWYHLGYLLTTHVKRKYGPKMWSKVLNNTSKHSYSPFAFSNALKKETGKNVIEIYNETMGELETLWKKQLEGMTFSEFRTINSAPRKVWTSYTFPRYESDNTIIAQKIGLDIPLTLVRLYKDGREKKIRQFSPIQHYYNRSSIKNGEIVWNEYIPDPRWGKLSYSDIFIFNIKNKKTRRITKKSRLFDPALSSDSKHVATVEFNTERKCTLMILDSKTGKELRRLPNSSNDLIISPSWSEDNSFIVFLRQNTHGRALSIINLVTEEIQDIIHYCWENITYPIFFKNFILYNSPYSGINNIYAIDMDSKNRYQVTSSKYGAFFPEVSPDGKKLIYNNYTFKGFDVAEMPLNPSKWKKIEEVKDRSLRYYEPMIAQEHGGNIVNERYIPKVKYEVKDYHPYAHLIKIHSWQLVPLPPDIHFNLTSNDKFNLFSLSAGPKYNINEKVFGFELNGSYTGLYPILNFGISYGGRSSSYTNEENKSVTYSWRETSAKSGFLIPLDLSRGIYSSSLTVGANMAYTKISGQEYTKTFKNGNGVLIPISYHLSFSRFRHSSYRDLKPSWGQYFTLSYHHTPWRNDFKGSLFSAKIRLYFPGFFKHHSLRVEGGFENQKPDNYHFESNILFPRGYDHVYSDSIYKASIDYALPLVYPDWSVGNIFYLKRIRTNLFYDYGIGRILKKNNNFSSVGIELLCDFHLFDFNIMLEMGSRFTYRIKDKKSQIELLIFDFSF